MQAPAGQAVAGQVSAGQGPVAAASPAAGPFLAGAITNAPMAGSVTGAQPFASGMGLAGGLGAGAGQGMAVAARASAPAITQTAAMPLSAVDRLLTSLVDRSQGAAPRGVTPERTGAPAVVGSYQTPPGTAAATVVGTVGRDAAVQAPSAAQGAKPTAPGGLAQTPLALAATGANPAAQLGARAVPMVASQVAQATVPAQPASASPQQPTIDRELSVRPTIAIGTAQSIADARAAPGTTATLNLTLDGARSGGPLQPVAAVTAEAWQGRGGLSTTGSNGGSNAAHPAVAAPVGPAAAAPQLAGAGKLAAGPNAEAARASEPVRPVAPIVGGEGRAQAPAQPQTTGAMRAPYPPDAAAVTISAAASADPEGLRATGAIQPVAPVTAEAGQRPAANARLGAAHSAPPAASGLQIAAPAVVQTSAATPDLSLAASLPPAATPDAARPAGPIQPVAPVIGEGGGQAPTMRNVVAAPQTGAGHGAGLQAALSAGLSTDRPAAGMSVSTVPAPQPLAPGAGLAAAPQAGESPFQPMAPVGAQAVGEALVARQVIAVERIERTAGPASAVRELAERIRDLPADAASRVLSELGPTLGRAAEAMASTDRIERVAGLVDRGPQAAAMRAGAELAGALDAGALLGASGHVTQDVARSIANAERTTQERVLAFGQAVALGSGLALPFALVDAYGEKGDAGTAKTLETAVAGGLLRLLRRLQEAVGALGRRAGPLGFQWASWRAAGFGGPRLERRLRERLAGEARLVAAIDDALEDVDHVGGDMARALERLSRRPGLAPELSIAWRDITDDPKTLFAMAQSLPAQHMAAQALAAGLRVEPPGTPDRFGVEQAEAFFTTLGFEPARAAELAAVLKARHEAVQSSGGWMRARRPRDPSDEPAFRRIADFLSGQRAPANRHVETVTFADLDPDGERTITLIGAPLMSRLGLMGEP
jgi:hypothetical protein